MITCKGNQKKLILIKNNVKLSKMKRKTLKKLLFLCLIGNIGFSQKTLPLEDLSAFKPAKEDWSIVGNAVVDLNQDNVMQTQAGKGVLACIHQRGKYGMEYELFTQIEHGDIDLDFDFMIARASNSGVYLQSRYEVQLMDSWGKKNPKYGDCGGIYERWDDSKSEGSKGYEGIAPRVNVAKAPGLWQNMKISFQAPRFDASGKKISNAKFLYIILNGVMIHENVELSGVTRGAVDEKEVSMAPIRIQGDHGCVAFRNIKYKSYNQQPIEFSDLKWGVYKGQFTTVEDIEKVKPETQGNTNYLNWSVSNEENNFGVKYVGKLKISEAGKYTFTTYHGGNTQMKINGKETFKNGWLWNGSDGRQATVDLQAGEVPIELYYWKTDGWLQPSLSLYIESETLRKQPLHVASSGIVANPTPIIQVGTDVEPVILRSFMDIPDGEKTKRVTHSVSVGNQENIHYSYDLDNGSIFQIWRGKFLNTAYMWYDRGDGSSRPLGSVIQLGDTPVIMQLNSAESEWGALDASYRPKGYELDDSGNPTFKYEIYGTSISDKITPSKEGKLLKRELTSTNSLSNTYVRLASAKSITKVLDDNYLINGEYFIKVSEGTPTIRQSAGKQELIVPITSKVSYSIIW